MTRVVAMTMMGAGGLLLKEVAKASRTLVEALKQFIVRISAHLSIQNSNQNTFCI